MLKLNVVLALAVMQFAPYTDSDLVRQSEFVVVARLTESIRTLQPPDGASPGFGRQAQVLAVQEVLKGTLPRPGSMELLLVVPAPDALLSSEDIVYSSGQQGLWFLRARSPGGDGLYLADHPQRFIPASDARFEEFLSHLRQP